MTKPKKNTSKPASGKNLKAEPKESNESSKKKLMEEEEMDEMDMDEMDVDYDKGFSFDDDDDDDDF